MNNRKENQQPEDFERSEMERHIKSIVIDSEYTTGLSNKSYENAEFEAILDLLECERTEKNADWRSDIFIPQFFSEIITQASIDASQAFQTRDFVETYVSDGTKTADANASERCINRTLNQKHLYYYHKYMRLRMINYLKGETYARFWWDKELQPFTRTENRIRYSTEIDRDGYPLFDPENQIPALIEEQVEVQDRRIIKDRVDMEVLDPRNVITDNSYVYSLQEKSYVIVRSETKLSQLMEDAEKFEYFNLDKLKEVKPSTKETDTAKETYNKTNDPHNKPNMTPEQYFDKIERFGKFWVIVKERMPDGYPLKVEPAYDTYGQKKENAEFIECLITFVKNANMTVLIGLQPQRCRDINGNPYRPLGRGLHYIHPTKDTGIGDGKPAGELQVAINDTFNISNDRTLMALFPTFKLKKYGNEDNATIRFEPEHAIELEAPEDLVEMKIDDNIQGASIQISFLKAMMEQALALSPSTMGMLPQEASTSATAIAGAEARTNTRSNYKSLTFENTFLSEQYWIIQQLTWQYAEPETFMKLLGDRAEDFNPDGDYYYKPVSQTIETEYSRNTKIKNLLMALSYVAQFPHPEVTKMINYIMYKFFTLMGDEVDVIAKMILNPQVPIQNVTNTQNPNNAVTNNQFGLPMTAIESNTREG